jgi:cell division protein ZipA
MDAGTLRIILILLGALLLGALYLRERERMRRESESDEPEPNKASRPIKPSKPPVAPTVQRREPSLGRHDLATASDDEVEGDQVAESQTPRRGSTERHQDRAPARTRDQAPDQGSAPASASTPAKASASAAAEEEGLLVQLFLVARGEPFDGLSLSETAERFHLLPGEMDIYHRHRLEGDRSRALFSMANLVKPGTFPFSAMEDFSTPGLALFAQLEGMPSDLLIYDELVQTARLMADELGAELLLPNRSRFDDAAWQALRAELLHLINERADALTRVASASEEEGDQADDERGAEAETGVEATWRRR